MKFESVHLDHETAIAINEDQNVCFIIDVSQFEASDLFNILVQWHLYV